MDQLQHLFDNNRRWAEGVTAVDADFFSRLVQGQSPAYLWIGCSDSRVPPGQIVASGPGGMFVHRNIANLVVHSDPSCLSVIHYAVETLEVPHIIVCGHYNCGGLNAALRGGTSGPVDRWLEPARTLIRKHRELLDRLDESQRWRKLCELNVIEQVASVARMEAVQRAWRRGQPLGVHGVIFELSDGLLREMGLCITGPEQIESVYRRALEVWTRARGTEE